MMTLCQEQKQELMLSARSVIKNSINRYTATLLNVAVGNVVIFIVSNQIRAEHILKKDSPPGIRAKDDTW